MKHRTLLGAVRAIATTVAVAVAVAVALTSTVAGAAPKKPTAPSATVKTVKQGKCTSGPCWLVTFDNGFVGEVAMTAGTKGDDPKTGKTTGQVEYRACPLICEWGWAIDQGKSTHFVLYAHS